MGKRVRKWSFTKTSILLLSLNMFEFINIRNRENYTRNVNSDQTIHRFKEKHFLSAILGALTITCLCCSLVEPVWFNIETVACCFTYVGLLPFMHSMPIDYFKSQTNSSKCKNKAGVIINYDPYHTY